MSLVNAMILHGMSARDVEDSETSPEFGKGLHSGDPSLHSG